MHTVVTEVTAELDAHRERFESFCRSLTPEQLARPVPSSTWIVRDFIAHLATIDGPVAEMFRAARGGGDAALRGDDGARFDVDDWNERQVQRRRALMVDDVLVEAAESRAALRVHLLALTDEDVARTIKFGGDGKRPPSEIRLEQYLRGWCKHDPMHALDMSRALPEAMTPGLEAWFDDPVIKGYQAAMNVAPRSP